MEIDVVGAPAGVRPDAVSGALREEVEQQQEAGKATRPQDADDDEEDACRICRNPGGDGSPLYHPCACCGSIKYVHQECLLQWLNHSNARQCEVCKHAFSFSPVYAENAPARLPFQELVLGIALKAGRGCKFFFRLAFVLSVWLLFIPFTTLWIWRLTFVRSFAGAHMLFISRLVPSLLLADCLHGFLLSAGIVFIFLGVTSLREYFRHVRELAGQDDREDDAVERQLGGRAGRRGGAFGRAAVEPAAQAQPVALANADVALGGQGLAAGAGQLIRRNAENVAARLEMQAARLEAHVEQMFDAVEDVDGAEDVPFDELVGMQGPVFHLVENAITVLASNAIFLGVVALIPFTIGRVILWIASRLVGSSAGMPGVNHLMENQKLNSSSPLVNNSMTLSAALFSLATTDVKSNNSVISVPPGGALAAEVTHAWESGLESVTLAMIGKLQLSDAGTVAVGYGVIGVALGLYLGLMALIRYGRGEPLRVARMHGVASMAEAAPSVARQMMAGLTYLATMVKVAFLLVIELGLFPLLCGWWLDICTLGMFDSTIAQRVVFFWSAPLTSCILHWLVGIVYMLLISIFVSLLREVLKPGVLYFLRDPADPNYNPFRDLIDDPIHKHARRVLLSVLVYGSLIVMLVFLPVQLAVYMAPSMFPLDLRVSDPFTEIPADMLLFHICIPFAVEHFRPRVTIKAVLHHWFSAVGWVLGLCEFLLPGPEDNNRVGNAGNHDADQVVRPLAALAEPAAAIQNNGETGPLLPAGRHVDVTDDSDEEGDSEEYRFAVRIALLLFGAWITLLLFNSSVIVLPISLGRGLFASVSRLPITRGAKCNDLYAFNIGCYLLWAAAAAVRYAADYLKTHNVKVLMLQILKWSAIVAKSAVLLTLWIVVLPVLIGLYFELLILVPIRVPINECPVHLLYQDWALGLVFLKIWTRLVMLGGPVRPLWDDSWRVKFEQVKADGFAGLRGVWIIREIIGPILLDLLVALGGPYVLGQKLFPLLGFGYDVDSVVSRFAWLGCLVMVIMWCVAERLHVWLLDLHNSIRDDRYLVGRRLHNFGEKVRGTNEQAAQESSGRGEPGVAEEGATVAVASEPSSEGTTVQEGATPVSSFTAGNLSSLSYVSGGIGAKGKKIVGGDVALIPEFQQDSDRKFGRISGSLRFRSTAVGAASSSSSTSSNSATLSQDQ